MAMNEMYMFLLLFSPVLVFIGFFAAKLLFRDHDYAEPTDVVVMPPDLTWRNYTWDLDIIVEISRAVIQLREKPPVTYEQIAPFLKSMEAHRVASQIREFHIYREHDIRDHLQRLDELKQKANGFVL
jgi:hypothetical protein